MRVVVVGIANLQTFLPVDRFPHDYTPTRYLPGEITTTVGGVGFNVARTLAALGDTVSLMCPLGSDVAASAVIAEAAQLRIDVSSTASSLPQTPTSVVLHDPQGRRQVNTDLGRALTATFTDAQFTSAARHASVAVLGNLDFSRPLLRAARDIDLPIAVDLQDVQGLDNPYDGDFVAAADILVMSHERLTVAHDEFLLRLRDKSRAGLIVLTLGAGGSLALTPKMSRAVHTPAARVGPTANTTGAGDTFMGALLHYYLSAGQPLEQALAHASAAAALGVARPPRTLSPDAVQQVVTPRPHQP